MIFIDQQDGFSEIVLNIVDCLPCTKYDGWLCFDRCLSVNRWGGWGTPVSEPISLWRASQSLVQGPFWGYPSLWYHVPSRAGGTSSQDRVPLEGQGYTLDRTGVPLPPRFMQKDLLVKRIPPHLTKQSA